MQVASIDLSRSTQFLQPLVRRSSHSDKNSDLAARVGRMAINVLAITRAESSIHLIEGANLLVC